MVPDARTQRHVNFEDRYGPLNRLLHRVAFRMPLAQRAMADVEELLFDDRLDSVEIDCPVFITALPRSGTTILLELLAGTGCFATHRYLDMPFLLAPLLWSRFSRPFAVHDTARERAHGDGLQISADSPEAFEEMVWKHFWPEHYEADRIQPWRDGRHNPEFDQFFETHMRKMILLRRDGASDSRRYLSKNNLNVARLEAPPPPLARGVFVIPFREPVQQAASMMRQHERFTEIHRRDDFVREYMEAIGHHEFGKGLKPVDFGGWLADAPDVKGLEFWVRYWIAAYHHVLQHLGPSTVLVSYRRLTEEPRIALADLATAIDIPQSDLVLGADRLHPPRTHDVDEAQLSSEVFEDASTLYNELQRHAQV